jgi:hypothetical protein
MQLIGKKSKIQRLDSRKFQQRNVGGFMWKWVMDRFEDVDSDKKYG